LSCIRVSLSKLSMKAGTAGRARASVTVKGERLFAPQPPQPAFSPAPPPLSLPLRAQLWARDGSCWEATYSPAGVRTNVARSFNAKSD